MAEPNKELIRECKVVCHGYQFWWTYKSSGEIHTSSKRDNCIAKCIDIKTKWEQNKKNSI